MLGGRVPNFLPLGETLNLTRWQTVQVNEATFETSVEGVFAGGDVATGAATVVEAVAAGRKAAYAIDKFITTGKAQPEPVEFYSRKDTYHKVSIKDLRSQETSPRRHMPVLQPDERKRAFVEVEQGFTREDVLRESARCLECGCTALFTCDLRRYATEYKVDIKQYLGDVNEHAIDRTHPLIDLDPNKCILCGRCVRMCSELVGVSAYGFIHRGFSTVVKPAMGGSLLDTDCVSCGMCIGTCPTAAVAQKSPLAKPGPWESQAVSTVCHYCGVGCSLHYDVFGDTVLQVSTRDDGVTRGKHCKKGRFGFHYVQSDDRLVTARIRAGRELEEAPLEIAIAHAALRLKELSRRHGGQDIAVFLSPRLTNEEIYLGQKLARIALGTHQVTSVSQLVNRDFACPDVVSTASYQDVEDAQALLVVNSNLDDEHLVVDLLTKRALLLGSKLIYIGPSENRTARFSDYFIRCRPGTEAFVVLGIVAAYVEQPMFPPPTDDRPELAALLARLTVDEAADRAGVPVALIRDAARLLAKSILKVAIFNKDYRGLRTAGDSRLFVEAAGAMGASWLALHEKSNMQGLLDLGASPTWLPGYFPISDASALETLEREWCVVLKDSATGAEDVAERLAAKKIRAAVILGEDPLSDESLPKEIRDGLVATEFLVVGDTLLTPTARLAQVVLPLSAQAETSGTMTSLERRVQRLRRAVPPRGGMETWEILCHLGAKMGQRFKMKYASTDDVFAEIRRVVPIYANVDLDGRNGEAIWDLGKLPPVKRPLGSGAFDRPVQPVSTLFLDPLERRFARWFEESMATARKMHPPPTAGEVLASLSR